MENYSTTLLPSHERNVASLPLRYRYFYSKCSDKLQPLVAPALTLSSKIRYCQIHRNESCPFLSHSVFVRKKFYFRQILSNNCCFVEHSRGCFSDCYNLNLFKKNFDYFFFKTNISERYLNFKFFKVL